MGVKPRGAAKGESCDKWREGGLRGKILHGGVGAKHRAAEYMRHKVQGRCGLLDTRTLDG